LISGTASAPASFVTADDRLIRATWPVRAIIARRSHSRTTPRGLCRRGAGMYFACSRATRNVRKCSHSSGTPLFRSVFRGYFR
jgi:hypothetical protein